MTSTITAYVDADKRKVAEKVFGNVGLTTSGAVNLFICAVAMSGGIPFAVHSSDKTTHFWRMDDGEPPRTGLRLGLADGKYGFAPDFDRRFDAMDAEIAELA